MDKYFYLQFEGEKIFARLSNPNLKGKFPAFLFLHGSGSNLHTFDFVIDRLKNKFICLAFDRLGCGKSEGRLEDYTLESQLAQAQFLLFHLLKLKNVDKNKIGLVGSSMGAHLASRLTREVPIKYLILRAPTCYHKNYENIKMTSGWLPWDRRNKDWPWKPSHALESISLFQGRLLIIRSERDEVVPGEMIREYYQRAKKAKERRIETIKGAPHRIFDKPFYSQKFLEIVSKFLSG